MVANWNILVNLNKPVLKSWSDGLPGKFRFLLPAEETQFVITAGEHQIVQDITEVIGNSATTLKF